jgi:hypothetical protein
MVKQYKVICPLINFQVSNILIGHTNLSDKETLNLLREREKELVEGIELFDGVKIRRISKEDIEDLKNSIFPLPSDKVISPNMFTLVKHIITEDGPNFLLDNTIWHIILAMRLLKKGDVSGNCIFYILISEKLEKFVSIDLSCEGSYRSVEPWLSTTYVLYLDEISALKKKVSQIQSINFAEKKRLSLACKRFQRAYEEGDNENQLIDYMIAFEALFVKKDIQGKYKNEKIANGCSDLLGKNDEEKEKIRSFLCEAYSIRDHIVHAAEYKIKDEYEIPSVVSKTEDYLRESINKLLD